MPTTTSVKFFGLTGRPRSKRLRVSQTASRYTIFSSRDISPHLITHGTTEMRKIVDTYSMKVISSTKISYYSVFMIFIVI